VLSFVFGDEPRWQRVRFGDVIAFFEFALVAI